MEGKPAFFIVGTILLVAFAVVIILVALKASSDKEEENWFFTIKIHIHFLDETNLHP